MLVPSHDKPHARVSHKGVEHGVIKEGEFFDIVPYSDYLMIKSGSHTFYVSKEKAKEYLAR